MKVIQENNFTPDDFQVASLFYKFYEGETSFISARFAMVGLDELAFQEEDSPIPSILQELRVKVLFSALEIEEPSFDDVSEFSVSAHLEGSRLSLNIPFSGQLTKEFYIYLKFYNQDAGFATSYQKVFSDQLLSNGRSITENFVDLRLGDTKEQTFKNQNAQEYDNEIATAQQKEKFGYHYISNLFHSFGANHSVNCFFGVDQKQYFIDNNSIHFLKIDPKFEDYLANNNFILEATSFLYNPETETSHIVPTTVSDYKLEEVFGTLYEASFQLLDNFNHSKEVKFRANCVLRDAITQYIIEELNPKLEEEFQFLNTPQFLQQTFVTFPKASIEKTLEMAKAIYVDQFGDAEDKFLIFDNSTEITVDNDLANIFITINQHVYKTINATIENKDPAVRFFDTTVSLQRSYEEAINFSKIGNGAEVLFSESILEIPTLPSLTTEELLERGRKEVQKYFEDATVESYVRPDGEEVPVDLVGNSFLGMSANYYLLNQEIILDNDKAPNNRFDYDAFLKYIEAIDKIVSNNINYDLKVHSKGNLVSVTPQEYITERASESLTGLLNSLTVTQIPELKDERERRDYLSSLTNIVKTFEIPSTLRTDLCVNNSEVPMDGFIPQVAITPKSIIGNNVLAFSVMSNVESFSNKNFYDFYKSYIRKDINLSSLPIQALYLYNYYNRNEESPAFLNKDELLRQFVVYGAIYFMFKSLFCIKIFIPEQNRFVKLNGEVLESLKDNSDYLCRIDQYNKSELGMEVPELLRTSIYNRYFVLQNTEDATPTISLGTPQAQAQITY